MAEKPEAFGSKIYRSHDNLKQAEKAYLSPTTIDRSEWKAKFYASHADVQEQVKERISPLDRLVSFSRTYMPMNEKEISSKDVITLALQHLQAEKLVHSREKLESAAKQKLDPLLLDKDESRLATLLRIALKETDRIWELTIGDRNIDTEENYSDLSDHLYDLGLLEEEADSANDTNIWDEPDEDNIIWEKDGKTVKAATLNKLVVQLTHEKNHDMQFQKTFLTTYKLFTTPEKLLKKLIQRYRVPIRETSSEEEKKQEEARINTIQLRTINVLKKTLAGEGSELNEQHIAACKAFLEKHLKNDNRNLYNQLIQVLRKQSTFDTAKASKQQQKIYREAPPDAKIDLKVIFSPKLSLFDIDPLEMARQMTLIDYSLFVSIKASELLNQAWTKPKLRHHAKNVLIAINRFNVVSTWVSSAILKEEKLRTRTKIMNWMINIAKNLRKLNNLSSVIAIIAGLNNAAVGRLKFTRDSISKENQQKLEGLISECSSENGYSNYRKMLAAIQGPCIPYLGVYLTDLVFIDEGNQNFVPSPNSNKDLINFGKRRLMTNIIFQIQQFQQSSFNLRAVPQIVDLLDTESLSQQCLPESDMYEVSLKREPRDTVDPKTLL